MDTTTLTTGGGVTISRTASHFDPAELTRIAALVDRRRGGVLSSGMEYPGRYTRWHMAYVNPPVEIATVGRRMTARALNERGRDPDAGDRRRHAPRGQRDRRRR